NSMDADAPYMYYALALSAGDMDFYTVCHIASKGCTITQADISAAFYAVVEAAVLGLKEGKVVRLGNFGSLQLSVRSTGTETKESFSVSQVKGARIRFRPGGALTEMLPNLKYHQVEPRGEKKKENPGTTDPGNGSEEI
ncbi:MAG: HU family DNA-binding protein, partial [Bacteroides sp.]|nr:HU family DNA-binding protein [Bacteroides sp.]